MSRPVATFNVIRHKLMIKTGPRAAPSGAAAARYVWTQATASTTWTITHSLSDFSHVTFFDSSGLSFLASFQRVSATQIVANFNSPRAGTAHIS